MMTVFLFLSATFLPTMWLGYLLFYQDLAEMWIHVFLTGLSILATTLLAVGRFWLPAEVVLGLLSTVPLVVEAAFWTGGVALVPRPPGVTRRDRLRVIAFGFGLTASASASIALVVTR